MASLSLYDYADGDPVNGLDPDGRYASQTYQYADSDYARFQQGVEQSLQSALHAILRPIKTTQDWGSALGALSVEVQSDPLELANRRWTRLRTAA